MKENKGSKINKYIHINVAGESNKTKSIKLKDKVILFDNGIINMNNCDYLFIETDSGNNDTIFFLKILLIISGLRYRISFENYVAKDNLDIELFKKEKESIIKFTEDLLNIKNNKEF